MAQVGLLEDNSRIARLCATMLRYAGHHVTVYEHPRECLNALLPQTVTYEGILSTLKQKNLSPLPVEVLILDLHLPDIDGIEVLHFLGSHPQTKTLPLVFCTASTPAEVACALRVAPCAEVVEKPFKFQSLISAITKALANEAR